MLEVSIIIPVIRPERAKRCIEAIKAHAGIPEDQYEIITEEDKKRIGVAHMVKRLVEKTKAPRVCFLGDDTVPQRDFLKNALKAMAAIPDGWGLVSFNDNPTTTRSAAHWVADKRLLPMLDGEFFHTGYKHCFCDDELLVRCQQANRYIYAYDAYILHEHPMVEGQGPTDPDYKRVYAPEIYNHDHELFQKRMANGWKTPLEKPAVKEPQHPYRILIGVPSGDMLHAHFAMNLVNLCILSISKGIRVAICNPQFSLVEVARNEIVKAALDFNASHVMMLDSDMTFPPETLLQLLSHDKDIVCCDAVRRRPPITQVLLGMDGKPLKHVAKDKLTADMDQLVEVKGGSSAVSLVKIEVFKRLSMPYFLVEWNGKSFLGEDYYFSNKARKAGYKMFCDRILSPHIGHIGTKQYTLADGEAEVVK